VSLILIVEEEVTLSLLAAMTLEDEGYEVVVVANGIQGVEAVRERAPDLVVTDYMMPVMDGVEMIRALREDGFAGPVLLTSAVAEAQIPGAEALAYEGFLAKPYHEHRLLKLIEAQLGTVEKADGEVAQPG